jgi:ferredoxin-thioredoxin reductase catalytic chain
MPLLRRPCPRPVAAWYNRRVMTRTPTRGAAYEADFDRIRTAVERRIERYLRRSPYRLFPDDVIVRHLIHRLARNVLEHGRQYCPCRKVTGDRDADRPNICPCRSHHEDIARDGHCECRLFVSQEFAARGLK